MLSHLLLGYLSRTPSYSLNMVTSLHRCALVIFDGGPTFRGPIRVAVSFPYTSLCKSCYRISSVAKYHWDPIMVLYWRPYSQVVHVPVWSSQNARGSQKGGIVEKFNPPPPPSPLKIGSGKLVLDKKFPPDKLNALEWSKRMYEEVSLLAVPFRSKHFDAFWHFLSFFGNYTHIMGTTNLIG